MVTVSEANGGAKKQGFRKGKFGYHAEHWTEANARHNSQKKLVFSVLRRFEKVIKLPCKIIFTRYAPRTLDKFDNLPMALKWVLDACCAVITGDYRPGRADSCELIDVSYLQEKSEEYGVKIRIEF